MTSEKPRPITDERFERELKALNRNYSNFHPAFCETTRGQFPNFQVLFVEQSFGRSGKLSQFAGQTKLPSLLQKVALSSAAPKVESSRERASEPVRWRKIENMHARPEIREILIAKKMRRWAMIGQHPFVDPTCSPARARRNFARLLARHPDLGRRLNLTVTSAYPPV
jgi:hypothetical protein